MRPFCFVIFKSLPPSDDRLKVVVIIRAVLRHLRFACGRHYSGAIRFKYMKLGVSARKDFPIYANYKDPRGLCYLDSGATSLKPAAVINAQRGYEEQYSTNVHRAAYHLAERATEEGIYEYKKWGFLACERPGLFGSFDPASRKNILRRLFEKKGEISLKDYLSALLFSISRQQALLDIKSSGIAEPAGRGRNARWKMAARLLPVHP